MKTNELIVGDVQPGMIVPDSEFGKKIGFTSDKFDGWLWEDGRMIFISFIISLDEGKGNLKRLFDSIQELGYSYFVPTPFPRMCKICTLRGMVYTVMNLNGERVEGYLG